MKCADPILCYLDSKGNRKFRNFSFAIRQIGGIPNSHIVFDCGKCLTCRKKKAYELASRCVLHASLYQNNCFLTLTYDEKKEGYHNEFDYTEIQKFKKRLRRHLEPKRIEIFNVHEYGKNGKKHWHLVVFNHDFADKEIHTVHNGTNLYTSEILAKLWPHGFNTIGDVSAASAMYTAQYMEKDFKNRNVGTKKKSHSKHSGIGKPYFLKNYRQLLILGYVPINGTKLPLPRLFEKTAHKHYCHFYDKQKFFDTASRKAVYRPFKLAEENLEIANLYVNYLEIKKEKIKELEESWNTVISQYLTTNKTPDFIKANSNALYDLQRSEKLERF